MSASNSPISNSAAERAAPEHVENVQPLFSVVDEDMVMSEGHHVAAPSSSPSPSPSVEVKININEKYTAEMRIQLAKEDLEDMKSKYYVCLGNYLLFFRASRDGEDTKRARELSKEAEKLFKDAEETLKVRKISNARKVPVVEEKNSFVPPGLPFLQLVTDAICEKPHVPKFDSVYDFCQEFTTDTQSWFEDKLAESSLNWKAGESELLDYYDIPLRKFLNMGRVWFIKQGASGSVRSFGAKFQKLRRQACLEDAVQSVLCFWWNVRPEFRKACMVPLAANYRTKMPSNVEDIIALVTTTTLDTSSLLLNHGETSSVSDWKSFAEGNGTFDV
ncbi:hypothetical protein INT47_005558 [Mucor saturninus]|uniref:Uncharacterized protein n=1 Tax=Mucor saturninus TaxID=64648 RepID=A0A8H7RGL3_9FUNG|nr:hypothetical protein INT47_005558 [Mucor saturninus]